MSDCNCKKNIETEVSETDKKVDLIRFFFKVLAFLVLLVLSPFIYLFMIYLMFNSIVLNKSIDIKPILVKLGTIFNEKENYDDDFHLTDLEYKVLTEEDVVLVDSEELK